MKLHVALLAALALTSLAAGQDKYVSPAGSDTNPGTFAAPYRTIQKGIDNVGNGFTVHLAPGTYTEVLLVDPTNFYGTGPHGPLSFTLLGQAGVTVQWPLLATRQGGYLPAITSGSGRQMDFILWAAGPSDLKIRQIDFDGRDDMDPATSTVTSTALGGTAGATMDVYRCTISGIQDTPSSGLQGGAGVYVFGAGTKCTVRKCTMSSIQKAFALADGPAELKLFDCVLNGRGPTSSIAQNAVQFSYGGSGEVRGCTLNGFWWSGSTWTSAGILCYDSGAPIAISGNRFFDTQTGIYWFNASAASVGGLTITDNFMTRIAPATGHYDGIDVYNTGTTSGTYTILNNIFSQLGGSGLWTNTDGGTFGGNYFNASGENFNSDNAVDDASPGGNNWIGNNWSDFAENAGFPSVYFVPGSAGAIDGSPSSTVRDLGPSVPLPTSGASAGPTAVAAGLFNADALTDLVAALSDSTGGTPDQIEVFLSTGIAGGQAIYPTPGALYTVGDDPQDVAVGDLNGDSYPDLAVACAGDHTVHLLAGSAAGTFSPLSVLTFGASSVERRPLAVAIADLDGVGHLDLAIAFQGSSPPGGSLKILTNDGGGTTFTAHAVSGLPSIGELRDVLAADLDGDGDQDVVVSDSGISPPGDKVHLIANGGGASYAFLASLTAATAPRGLTAGDLDRDGDLDLAVGCFGDGGVSDDGAIVTFLGDGTGAFPTALVSAGRADRSGPTAVAMTDLGGDSNSVTPHNDVVGLNSASATFTALLDYRITPGRYLFESTASSGGSALTDLIATDLNGDVAPDVVIADIGARSLFIHYGIVRALVERYGVGCAGVAGIPAISTSGAPAVPTIGNSTFTITLDNARPLAPAALLAGDARGALPGGCANLLVDISSFFLVFSSFTDPDGEASLPVPVPGSPYLEGLYMYFQWVVLDPSGGFLTVLSLSEGLSGRVGR